VKILILGSGLMGPAAAYNAFSDPSVEQVTIADINQEQLNSCAAFLRDKSGASKVNFVLANLADVEATAHLMAGFDAVVAALPRPINVSAIKAALQAKVPLVDLAQTFPAEWANLKEIRPGSGQFIIIGCGVEPGLTEIVARHLAEKMDRVDECHIKCGGIPENPKPPLDYKIVFGGRRMPLRDTDSEIVKNGEIDYVARYSGVEPVTFDGVGQCEAWHEGFKPWILDIPAMKNLKQGTQKTVRWPGYAQKITVLKDLGLLSLKPVQVDGVSVIPKHLVDSVLYPYVKLEDGEPDITCFRVELIGEKEGHSCIYTAEMVDRYDHNTGFTSMARTTAFTGAVVARMIASGKLTAGEDPIVTPEKVISGSSFDLLIAELEEMNMHIEITVKMDQG